MKKLPALCIVFCFCLVCSGLQLLAMEPQSDALLKASNIGNTLARASRLATSVGTDPFFLALIGVGFHIIQQDKQIVLDSIDKKQPLPKSLKPPKSKKGEPIHEVPGKWHGGKGQPVRTMSTFVRKDTPSHKKN